MDRKKVIYIGLMLIISIFVTVTYFSYAFFIEEKEYHGKLNIIVGTLDYKMDSIDLNNNSISLLPNETKSFYVDLKSLNTINSKYGLVYSSNCENLDIGYINLDSLPAGIINSNETKRIVVKVKNNCSSNANVLLNVEGGFIYNDLITNETSINVEKNVEALDVGYDNDGLQNCTNVQCALDEISNMLDEI